MGLTVGKLYRVVYTTNPFQKDSNSPIDCIIKCVDDTDRDVDTFKIKLIYNYSGYKKNVAEWNLCTSFNQCEELTVADLRKLKLIKIGDITEWSTQSGYK